MTKIIKFTDGLDVEIEINENQAHEIADHSVINASIDQVQTFLKKVMQPFSNTYKELSKDMNIDSTKISIGVKVGIEGNFILAKSSAEANIQVEMTLRPINA
ncbi:MAG: CU044_2847 family protein [Sulfuricurvum sp.]|uniref:CU044_2847 family protein n=1 Tax=Sulfuricurvum sp. TaxID=2025608 RepID=UPI0027357A28|nr:CU044_2847 family protein [Sulfuricurvum sp.]MDP2851168.1 CU044_2847 family protein [Sulfuricurvum sp.]